MKQIKTIQYNCDYNEDFDHDVNEAIKDGWALTNRILVQGSEGGDYIFNRMYVAYLEKDV